MFLMLVRKKKKQDKLIMVYKDRTLAAGMCALKLIALFLLLLFLDASAVLYSRTESQYLYK